MNINDLTIGQAKELAAQFAENKTTGETPFEIGKAYFIRTVTYHATGRLVGIKGGFLILEKAAMIADSKRFFGFLTDWKNNNAEIEPFKGRLFINRWAVTDATEWDQSLPDAQL